MDSSAVRSATRNELANAIRALSMDAVQKANSGHPGMPMGMADIAEVLWNDYLRHNPGNPKWFDRDRFVVSNGHGSMLLYSLLHLSGYDLPIEELKNFRQLHSRTPGHPEYGLTPGVETTTGPLGQGLANAVGMALAERMLAARFNRPGFHLVNHHTYCFVGDGCLMEGISHEACSLAGVLGLGKLVVFYDDNGISIDGEVAGWFLDDTPARFEAYGWQVVRNVNGHDPGEIKTAIETALKAQDKPTLICCKTVIGFGAPNKQGTEGVHGAALGKDEVAAARVQLNWPHAPFEIPEAIRSAWDARARGAQQQAAWQEQLEQYRRLFPGEAAELERRIAGELPAQLHELVAEYVARTQSDGKDAASRKASQNALNVIAPVLPELIGGSADLSESNCTVWSGCHPIKPGQYQHRYISYGVREFGMSAIMNGMALHGAVIPYGGTFLTFTDYARNAIRMAALMRIRTIFVCTHDSIGLGEDGPTHQPIEHLATLRMIPGLHVWRPCDAVETAVAWECAIKRADGPAVLALSRQNLAQQARTPQQVADIARGGYVLWQAPDAGRQPDAIIISTGSEIALAVDAAKKLLEKGRRVRVVSMPCADLFHEQDAAYRESVLPHDVTHRLAVEAGVPDCWFRFVGRRGRLLGIDRFGESAPAPAVYKALGLTLERVIEEAEKFFS